MDMVLFLILVNESWAGIIILLLCENKHHIIDTDTTGRLPFYYSVGGDNAAWVGKYVLS